MAKHCLYNVSAVVNGVDLSTMLQSIEINVNTNALQAAGMQERQDYSIPGTDVIDDPQLTFDQDYAAAKVYATFMALWQAHTTFNIVAKVDAGATAATNPAWTIPVFVKKMPLLQGSRGDKHMAPVTLAVAGALSVATS